MTTAPATGPIFLLAFERSGTNLLRRFLRRHPAIDGPSPTHLLSWLGRPGTPIDAPLDPERFARLVDDAITTVGLPFEPWSLPLEREAILAALPAADRSLLGLFGWLLDRHAKSAGKQRWFCKDKELIDHAELLAARWPTAGFIYLHRDPRDVFASYKKAPGGYKHPLPFIDRWGDAQRRTLALLHRADLGARIFHTSYERLLADERREVEGMCTYLGLPFSEDLLQTGGGQRIASDNAYWKNVEKPVMRDNSGGFRRALRRGEVRAIEQEAWDVMAELGYRPEVAAGPARAGSLVRRIGRLYDAVARRWSRRFTTQSDAERAVVRRRAAFRRRLAARAPDA